MNKILRISQNENFLNSIKFSSLKTFKKIHKSKILHSPCLLIHLPVLPQVYAKSPIEVRNFLYDSDGICNSRSIIFSTRRCLHTSSNSDHIFFDSTFEALPSLFYKLFTIYAITQPEIVPCVYA
ncbi:hypothetical protein HZS_2392 [Henneguya salminicola]|nr:hypothetical protein HZS_2392 [Henneguya salminicola]